MSASNPLARILETNRLTGLNYKDWFRNLKIVLSSEKLGYVLDQEPPILPDHPSARQSTAHDKWMEDDVKVKCYMLASMSNELQSQHEDMPTAKAIITHLQELYGEQSRTARFEVTKRLFNTKMREGQSVHDHCLTMIKDIEQLEKLGIPTHKKLQVDLILQSLTSSFAQFVMNYNMNKLNYTLPELLNMLVSNEGTLKSSRGSVLAVEKASSYKRKSTWKKKKPSKKQKKENKSKKKDGPKKATTAKGKCFHCNTDGHWKRNCPLYLESLKKQKADAPSEGMSMLVIESNLTVTSTSSWVLDSGSSAHISTSMQGLVGSRGLREGDMILRVGNGAKVVAVAVGAYPLSLPLGFSLILKDCYHVPVASRNLISISVLAQDGYEFNFNKDFYSIYLRNKLIARAFLIDGLYHLHNNASVNINEQLVNVVGHKRPRDDLNQKYMWHLRLGHIGEDRINKLVKDRILDSVNSESYPVCESCLQGKMTKLPFVGHGKRATELLALVHTDVCGPFDVQARGGFQYFITFTDDYSRYGYVFFMKHKSEAFEKFKEFRHEVEKQTGKLLKVLRSDRGGEYLSGEFLGYLKDHGIVSQWTPPGTPQLNGVSERRNRTLLDMVRSMMSFTDLPMFLWGHALQTSIYILNRVHSKSISTTPYEIWHGKKPSLGHLKIWGCPAYVKRLTMDKLESRSMKARFIGYPKESIGYYFYFPKDHNVIVSRHATFLEKQFIQDGGSGRSIELEERVSEEQPARDQVEPNEPVDVVAPPSRRSNRASHPPERYLGIFKEDIEEMFLVGDKDQVVDPKTYDEAMSDIDSEKWLSAMKSEIDSMHSNQVWSLVDPPEGIVPIGCKWIYKRKIGADGKVETFKARLVAKGYSQREGIDYHDTFSPVAMLKSIRTLLAIAAFHDYEIWQMDVKTAFLNGYLEEDIYMEQPLGFTSSDEVHKVCKLHRSIYGLKQASRSWNTRFNDAIKSFDFIKNEEEPCIYKKVSGRAITFLVLYVDDILLIGNDIPMLTSVKSWLSKEFSMKDLGEASYILGIKVYRDRPKRMLGLSQKMYIEEVLKRFGMENSKRGLLSLRHGIRLSKKLCPSTPEEIQRMNKIPYASAIGSLMYAMLCTRPDIALAVSVTSRYQSNPGEEHWTAVKNILKYLRRTKDLFLVFGGNSELRVEGYTDSDFMTDPDDRKSTSGCVFLCNGGSTSWKSSKQSIIADSTMEAEYIAASEAAKEAFWYKKFIAELGVMSSDAIPLYCDNNGAIALAKEPRSHQKSKHIERRFHIIRDYLEKKYVEVRRVDSADNVADPLTKLLSQQKTEVHLEKMGLRYMANWL